MHNLLYKARGDTFDNEARYGAAACRSQWRSIIRLKTGNDPYCLMQRIVSRNETWHESVVGGKPASCCGNSGRARKPALCDISAPVITHRFMPKCFTGKWLRNALSS